MGFNNNMFLFFLPWLAFWILLTILLPWLKLTILKSSENLACCTMKSTCKINLVNNGVRPASAQGITTPGGWERNFHEYSSLPNCFSCYNMLKCLLILAVIRSQEVMYYIFSLAEIGSNYLQVYLCMCSGRKQNLLMQTLLPNASLGPKTFNLAPLSHQIFILSNA